MTQKVVGVIEMTYLYDARYSFVLFRPKNEVKFLTQIVMFPTRNLKVVSDLICDTDNKNVGICAMSN